MIWEVGAELSRRMLCNALSSALQLVLFGSILVALDLRRSQKTVLVGIRDIETPPQLGHGEFPALVGIEELLPRDRMRRHRSLGNLGRVVTQQPVSEGPADGAGREAECNDTCAQQQREMRSDTHE